MHYPAYLLCLVLMTPAFALATLFAVISMLTAGVGKGLWRIVEALAFFGAGIEDPLRYGWRILTLVAVIGFLLTAGAIPQLRHYVFHGLGLLGTACVVFCLITAARHEGAGGVFSALVFLSPSVAAIAGCLWFARKFA